MSADISPPVDWVPLKLCHVQYPKGDVIGKLLALISLSPFGVLSAFVALIIFRRDLHTITFFIGALINLLLNSVLKKVIAASRPAVHSLDDLYNEYGMPSAHTQFMWFLSTYMFYFIFFRSNYIKSDIVAYIWKALVATVFFVWALLVSFGRIYLRYHTIEQVLVGVIVGAFFATIWFVLTQLIFTPYFPIVTSWKISEILLIRDTTVIPNIFWFEYFSTRQEAGSSWRRKSDTRKSQ